MAMAFIVGFVLGGLWIYSIYHNKWQWALKMLRELDVKYGELRAQVETLELFYGVKEEKTNGQL